MSPRPRLPRLIPEPVTFNDPVKRAAARSERAWEVAIGAFGGGGAAVAGLAAAGVAVPPLIPVFAGLVVVGGVFKMRARWAKEDPPRGDFETPATLRPRSLDVAMLVQDGELLPAASLVGLVDAATGQLEATVVSLEKAMGAGIEATRSMDQRMASLAAQRHSEAVFYAERASWSLKAVGFATREGSPFAELARRIDVAQLEPYAGPDLLDALSDEDLGLLVAAGIDPGLVAPSIELGTSDLPSEPLPTAIQEISNSSYELGGDLGDWASHTGEGGAEDEGREQRGGNIFGDWLRDQIDRGTSQGGESGH